MCARREPKFRTRDRTAIIFDTMNTTLTNRTNSRFRRALHDGLVRNGAAALAGVTLAMVIRALSHHGLTMRGDGRTIFDILFAAALIAYCLAECERRIEPLFGVIVAVIATSVAVMTFKFSGTGWVGPFGLLLGSTMAMKPLGLWISKVLLSVPGRRGRRQSPLNRRGHGRWRHPRHIYFTLQSRALPSSGTTGGT